MMKENIVIWQKWVDPFGSFGEEEDKNDYDSLNEDDMPNYSQDFLEDNKNINLQNPIKVISTPMGIIPINEDTASGKIFNFWSGHTNFDITANISNLIESIDGVEALNVFTRYRFRIAIGKAFVDSVVMNNIQTSIYQYLEIYHDEQ